VIGVKRLKKGLKMGIPLSLVRMKVLEISLYVKADFSERTKSQQTEITLVWAK